MQFKLFLIRMAAPCVALANVLLNAIPASAQVQDTDFSDDGQLIINHSVYDLATGSAVRDGRLLIGNSEYDWYMPRIDAFENDGDQDFGFGSGGDVTWGWFEFPSIETGSILYTDDAIYVGYTTHPEEFRTTIRKYDLEGDVAAGFGTEGLVSEAITTFDVVWWYDSFGGIQQWGEDVVMVGATPDTTFIWRINADGTPDAGFGTNGLSRLRWSDYFIEGNAYNIHSWFALDDKLYFNMEYYDIFSDQSFKYILPINDDGSLDVDGMLNVTALNHSAILTDGETIYLKKGTNLQRCIGTTFTVDDTFGEGGTLYNTSGWGCSYAFGPDGSIYQYGSIGTSPMMAYCGRFTSNGQLDTGFGEEGILTADALVENDQVWFTSIAITDDELYLIGNSGVFGVSSGGYSDLFVLRYTDINASVAETKANDIPLYPNPANETVSFQLADVRSWSISNLQGQTICSGMNTGTFTTLDISELPSGAYILISGDKRCQFFKQ